MTRLLVLLAALLGGVLVVELLPGEPEGALRAAVSPPATPGPASAAVPARAAADRGTDRGAGDVAGRGTPPPGAVATILERPLFSPNRRPAAPVETEAAPTDPLPRLAGITTANSQRFAIFAPADGGKYLVLPEGARLADLVVQSIEPDRVVLADARGTRILRPATGLRERDAGPEPQRLPAAPPNGIINIPGPIAR